MSGRFELREPAPAPFLARLPSYPWFVVGAVCVGAFMGQADASIVQLAMPAFEDAFDAPLDAVSWVAIAYVVAFVSALPVFARLAEIAGRKSLYLIGFTLFGLASAFCALAPGLASLIAFRVLLGISGAMLGANSVVIVVAAAGGARRGKALGVQAAAQAVGLSVGPALGGLLIGAFGWRSIFWIAVPSSILGTALAWLLVPKTANLSADRRFDVPGALLLAPALAALLLALSEVRAWGFSAPLFACLAAAPILLAAFVRREFRAPAPLVDLRLFGSAAFSAGGVGVVASYAMLYAIFFAMSFALIRGYHESALAAGLRLTVVPVALGVFAPISGALSDKWPRFIMLTGMALCAASAVALTRLLTGAPDSLPAVMAALGVFGVGLGCYIAPNNSATIGAAPSDKSGVAGGLLNLLRIFGSGFGVAAASTTLAWRIEAVAGIGGRTSHAPEGAVLAGVGAVLTMLAILAAIGALAAMIRNKPGEGVRELALAAAPAGGLRAPAS